MATSTARAVIPLIWMILLSTACLNWSFYGAETGIICSEKEKQALLHFKQGLTDPLGRLSSWTVHRDCCLWAGVRCDNSTGRIIELHLGDPSDFIYLGEEGKKFRLSGVISSALLELEFLSYLNLSRNYFGGIPIPSFLGSTKSLKYLDLRGAGFGGLIPRQLGNLSNILCIDLGWSKDGIYVDDLSWVAHLHTLEFLDLTGVNIQNEGNWIQVVSMLPSLSELHLLSCNLHSMNPPLGYVNLTNLRVLNLGGNGLNSMLPNWFFNLSSLADLNLGENSIYGKIPDQLVQLKYLRYLDLSDNKLIGPIPNALGNLSSLEELLIGNNQLNGTLPKSIGLLSNLRVLDIRSNYFEGLVSELHFAKLKNLKVIYAVGNSLFFNINTSWIPPFQLKMFLSSSNNMGPNFPSWIRTQNSLEYLEIAKAGISGKAPDWLWDWASGIEIIGFSRNQISGNLSHVLLNSSFVDLSSNRFTGQLPHLSSNVRELNVANNHLSGTISSSLCRKSNGQYKVEYLNMENNLMTGELPDCWICWSSLIHMNLGKNALFGKIPTSIGSLYQLQSLRLHKNHLSGDIPLSLKNCSLTMIDLGENKFTGVISSWIGDMINLQVLRLTSNKFIGHIPSQICRLSSIFVLDLSHNKLVGSIPKCLNNMSGLATSDAVVLDYDVIYEEELDLVTKGVELEYNILKLYAKNIDLSSNFLSGSIPSEISSLHNLRSLNLSHNQLVGRIPENVGNMVNLESVDLSNNHLSGEIPESMSRLTFLQVLNLCNNLFGKIPTSTQLQGFNETCFAGNAGLCGPPLSKSCTNGEESQGGMPVDNVIKESEIWWFYMGMVPGFAVGFFGVCTCLLFNRTWRHAYFLFVDSVKDRIYVTTVIKMKWLRRMLKRLARVD